MNTDVYLELISMFTVVALLAVLDLQGYDGKPHTTRKAIKYQYRASVWSGNIGVRRTKVSCFSRFKVSDMLVSNRSLLLLTGCSACCTRYSPTGW